MPSKYHNRKTVIGGIEFDSKKEAEHYMLLKHLEREGKITNLRRQVPYELIPAVYEDGIIRTKHKTKDGVKIVEKPGKICVQRNTRYFADFVYNDDKGVEHVVDVKSVATRMKDAYILKKKMMRAFLGIAIKEV